MFIDRLVLALLSTRESCQNAKIQLVKNRLTSSESSPPPMEPNTRPPASAAETTMNRKT